MQDWYIACKRVIERGVCRTVVIYKPHKIKNNKQIQPLILYTFVSYDPLFNVDSQYITYEKNDIISDLNHVGIPY